jgi:phosphatidylglycerophosphate synthase
MERVVRGGPLVGLVGQVGVLAALDQIIGIGVDGWLAGLAYGLVTAVALTVGIHRAADAARPPSGAKAPRKASLLASAFRVPAFRTSGGVGTSGFLTSGLGYADWVTLTRATLVGGVAALVVHALHTDVPVAPLVAIASVALALDAVDGVVARRTGTASPLGARFDMEVDAFLILVLSVSVATRLGAWVLAIGAMRYAYVVAGWALPWLRRPVPPRYWRKVVAATQGVTLTAVTSGLFPVSVCVVAVAVALALLVESFGRDVVRQWRQRHERVTIVDQVHPIEGPEREMSPSG